MAKRAGSASKGWRRLHSIDVCRVIGMGPVDNTARHFEEAWHDMV